jgi:hypothetical protein
LNWSNKCQQIDLQLTLQIDGAGCFARHAIGVKIKEDIQNVMGAQVDTIRNLLSKQTVKISVIARMEL